MLWFGLLWDLLRNQIYWDLNTSISIHSFLSDVTSHPGTCHLVHCPFKIRAPWWRHQMETFPASLAFVWGIHRWPVNSPHKGQWRGALVFSLICALNKRLSKQSWGWWFETPSRSLWRDCNAKPPNEHTPRRGVCVIASLFIVVWGREFWMAREIFFGSWCGLWRTRWHRDCWMKRILETIEISGSFQNGVKSFNLTAFKFWLLYTHVSMHGKNVCIEFPMVPLKFHIKILFYPYIKWQDFVRKLHFKSSHSIPCQNIFTHTLNDKILYGNYILRVLIQIRSSVSSVKFFFSYPSFSDKRSLVKNYEHYEHLNTQYLGDFCKLWRTSIISVSWKRGLSWI